ncbi:MAG: outer membrane protein OmpA-like peptidoglycan-associated protein [Aureispira sp.]
MIELLKKNKISVEIRSHTDSRGSSKYNQELSEKRAKAVYNYLVKNKVSKYRLKYKGYGESKLLNKCKDGVKCSDDDHAKNRRTDFKVIGLR